MVHLLLFLICQAFSQIPDDLSVFISIGQSNMAGRASVHSWDSGILSDIHLLDEKWKWNEFMNPLNIYSNIMTSAHKQKLGPSWSFAGTLKNESVLEEFGMIINARGSTNLSMCWTKGFYKENCYDQSISRIQQFQKLYPKAQIKGVLWHQGESDCIPAYNPNYMKELSAMIDDLRKDLGMKNLPFIAGQLGRYNQNFTKFNEAILELPKIVPLTYVVTTENLVDRGDLIHFDWQSQHVLGYRYAQAMKKFL